MALFKIFRGNESQLDSVKLHDGYAYFTSDTGNLFIDVGDDESSGGKRIQVNAGSAIALHKDDQTIEIDDIVVKDAVKADRLAIGKSKESGGLTALEGAGALFAEDDNIPTFGTLPIKYGGTGAATQEQARENLDVYNKKAVDDLVEVATSTIIEGNLLVNSWQGDDESGYTYTFPTPTLRCGKNQNVPPIITFKTNQEEYSKIEKADATPNVSIVFTTKEKPTDNIEIIIIDAG